MHFPPSRKDISPIESANSSDEQDFAAANDAERPLPLPVPIPAVELDPAKLPTWQRAFILAPNVRFTRTPGHGPAKALPTVRERIASMVAQSETKPAERAQTKKNSNDAGSQVNNLQRRLAQAFVPEKAPVPAPVVQSDDVAARRAIEQAQNQRIPAVAKPPAAEASAPVITAPIAITEPIVTAAVAPAPTRRMTSVPDHLIWEMMSLGASENIEAGISRRALPASQPQPQHAAVIAPAAAPVKPNPTKPGASALAPTIQRFVPPAPLVEDVVVMPAPAPEAPQIDAPSAIHLYRQVSVRQFVPAPIEVEPQTFQTDSVASYEEPQVVEPAPVFHGIDAEPVAAPVARKPRLQTFTEDYTFPDIDLLQPAAPREEQTMSQEALEQSAGMLESILEDFGVKGEIIDVRPGPVVTLYEFAPAPGVKSSRVMNLSDDIARSMSALSARVAVIPGRNVIGIELPNVERETVYLRELVESNSYIGTDYRLPLCLGKTIGGEPVIAELAKMPHLLVAGTTGSGKSVAINTMILSLLYHLRPEECRLIMVDPKMLELSVYDGIPHLLTPVVTDPKKAVLALKWAVREMEERYRKMSRLNVRNIDGFNARVAEARNRNETIMISVPVGFDRSTGEQVFEEQSLDLTALPYIVVIVDEMADLMMVAGKEIEGAIQRLAQMARAAGIHLIMATQRPSVDVITGTIKANFPTRISFQVTSKIDSRTILGEQGAEHLLGQGDMLHMKGGGRIARVHGPFVSDYEVEKVVAHLKTQGQPSYLGSVTEDEEDDGIEEEEDAAVFDQTSMGAEDNSDDLYERAVKIVQRDKKCSTSYIQRRLSIGYNRAASLVERMEKEGLVGAPNHVGKREILGSQPNRTGEE
ncbi:DNA translocase FtsK [Neorhizobium sp. NCHU2750]|uniref:DNA translocase FtsK n=1 Tax=Neorhizobium sp. NCHU2750 TaxID=1825976 RepID=UPI000E77262F|nr:cell division protein [Neorhizobium sp. NCHU2750]